MKPDRSLVTLSLTDMARHLASGEVSSRELALAHLERLDAIQPRLRPMAAIFHERALGLADAADRRRREGRARSALDGAPLTLKENLDVAGERTTLGLPKRKDHRASEDAVVVSLLKEAGCVLLGKSNLSQAMLFHESRNPLFGETKNPFDESRTPGGSSGGEACAVAAYGSPAGIGTDIGGSIRVPAHFCGVFGLKPTVDRISNLGVGSGIPGQEVVRGQLGPLARSAEDLALLLEVLSPEACSERDPRVPPLPLPSSGSVDVKGLRVGFFVEDGVLAPSRAVRRATERARAVLEDAGCVLVPFHPPLCEELVFTYLAALSADGAETLGALVDRQDLDPALGLLWTLARLPEAPKKAAGLGFTLVGDRLLGRMLEVVGQKSVAELWRLTARARQIQAAAFAAWNHHALDAVLCPPHATPALPHGRSRDFTLGGALSIRYNFLNLPAGVAPVTTVRADEQRRELAATRLEKRAAEVDAGSAGLPVGVQVVARPFREEVVLRLLAVLEEGLRGDEGFPRAPLP